MTVDGLRIREAGPGDASRVAGMHVRSWLQAYRSFAPAEYLASLDQDAHRLGYWQPRLEAPREGSRTWIAFISGIPAGFVNNEPPHEDGAPTEAVPKGCGWVDHLHLAPEFRGRGVGAELFRQALDALASEGFREAVLWVYADNAEGRAFYERMGWKPDGTEASKTVTWTGRDGQPGSADLPMVRYRGTTELA